MTEPQLNGWMRSSPRLFPALKRLYPVFAVTALCLALAASSAHARGKKPPKSQYEIDLEKQEQGADQPVEPAVSLPGMSTAPVAEPVPQEAAPGQEPAAAGPESGQAETPAQSRQQAPEAGEEAEAPAPEGSQVYTVWIWQESRDCLWKLAKDYYGDPWKWKQIYLANRNTILDPGVIFPKQRIVIPKLNP